MLNTIEHQKTCKQLYGQLGSRYYIRYKPLRTVAEGAKQRRYNITLLQLQAARHEIDCAMQAFVLKVTSRILPNLL